jgi:integrase
VIGKLTARDLKRFRTHMIVDRGVGAVCGTNLLGRGASLMLIKEQLGHAFIDSTMIYVGAAPARLRSEYDFFKPAYI